MRGGNRGRGRYGARMVGSVPILRGAWADLVVRKEWVMEALGKGKEVAKRFVKKGESRTEVTGPEGVKTGRGGPF